MIPNHHQIDLILHQASAKLSLANSVSRYLQLTELLVCSRSTLHVAQLRPQLTGWTEYNKAVTQLTDSLNRERQRLQCLHLAADVVSLSTQEMMDTVTDLKVCCPPLCPCGSLSQVNNTYKVHCCSLKHDKHLVGMY